MKKVVIAFVAGALLMASGQALAGTVSMIGKKIDGEAKALVNGKPISNAIIIEGKSYAPLRDVASAFGATAAFNGGVIKINNVESNALYEVVGKIETLNLTKNKLVAEKERRTVGIEKIKADSAKLQAQIDKYNDENDWAALPLKSGIENNNRNIAENESRIADITKELSDIESQLAELERQKAELEA